MHILVMPSWYKSKESPNSGSFFREQAQALARQGHTVSVLVIRGAQTQTHWEKQQEGGITEYFLYVRSLPCHLTALPVMGGLVRLFRAEFRDPPVDIVHVHSYRCGRYARFIQTAFHIPYVVTEHFAGFRSGSVQGQKQKEAQKVFSHAAEVLAVSSGLRDAIAPLCPREVLVIPNMVSERFFTGGLREPWSGERFRFVSTGNLADSDKGTDVLLRAFARLHAKVPQTSLTIIGGGDKEPFEKMAEELGISEHVRFTGLISREDVARHLRHSQAFVLLGRVETFGISFVEAMACGLPIVMTKTDAWKMLIAPETGRAVEVGDDAGAAEAMEYVIEHYEDYDPAAIKAYCRERFSEENVCRRLTEIYEQVLRRE